MSWKAIDRNSKDYIEMKKQGKVKFYKTPDADPARPAGRLGQDHRQEVGREPAVQEGAGFAEGLRPARRPVAQRLHWSTSRWPTTTTSRQEGLTPEGGDHLHGKGHASHPAKPFWMAGFILSSIRYGNFS
jgi:hypothetical protein